MQVLSEIKQSERAYVSKAKDTFGGKFQSKAVAIDVSIQGNEKPAEEIKVEIHKPQIV